MASVLSRLASVAGAFEPNPQGTRKLATVVLLDGLAFTVPVVGVKVVFDGCIWVFVLTV